MANFGGGGGGKGLPRPAPNRVARQAAVNAHIKAMNSGNPKQIRTANARLTKAYKPQLGASKGGVPGGNPYPTHGKGGGFGHIVGTVGDSLLHTAEAALPSIQDIEHPLRFNAHSAKQQWEGVLTHPVREQQQAARGKYGREAQAAAQQTGALVGSVVKPIEHPGRDPWATVSTAALLPFGSGRILEEARAVDAAASAAREGSGLKGALAARKAFKVSKRIAPITDPVARHEHLVELANQAMEDPAVRDVVAAHRHEATVNILEPGQVTHETGGAVGQKIRQWLRPDFKGMGKYEKVGAKLDNPGAAEARKAQEELRAPARQARAAKLRAAQKESFAAAKGSENPLQTAALSRGVLKGALPSTGMQGLALSKEEQLAALEHIDSLHMYPHDRDRLVHAILQATEGKTPTPAEQTLMEKAFGRERVPTAQALQAGGLKNAVVQAMSVPRAIKSAGDLSWGFRQGLLGAVTNPREFAKAFKGTFKAAASEAEAQARMARIVHDPIFPLLVKMKVPITELGSAAHGAANISDKEEAIMSNWAEHLHEAPGVRSVPGVKHAAKLVSKGVRISDRAYVVPLNELRMGMATQFLHTALENGWRVDGKLGQDLGGLVGVLTGRGSLPGFLAKHRATINSVFFSPGLMSSRLHMLSPVYHMRLEPFARQQSLHAVRNAAITLGLILKAAQMAGAKVTWDPRNSDFGKIRFGNTRVDIGGGFSQYITLGSRLATQTMISSTTGKKTHLSGKYGGTSDLNVIQNFFQNKTSPVLNEMLAVAQQGRFGQPLTPTGELGNFLSPLLWSDMYQLATSKGPGGGPGMAAATFLPDLFGIGVQNYAPVPPKPRTGSSSFGGYGGSGGGGSFGGYGSSGSSSFGGYGG